MTIRLRATIIAALGLFTLSSIASAAPAPVADEPRTDASASPTSPALLPPGKQKADPLVDDNSRVADKGEESLTFGAPRMDEASVEFGKLQVRPYLLIAGGLKADFEKPRPGDTKNDRVSTYSLGRIGLRARWGDFVYVESEILAAGGVGLHGTSAFEGQASLQVRQQVIRLVKYGFKLEVGRLFDEASIDFFSQHIGESFLQDSATRDPLLFSGFNLGNGIRSTYEIIPGLRAGFTFNAANPVSTTASLLVGGAYPPYDRFYIQPYQQVKQSGNNFPDDTFHLMMFTPSILLDTKYFDAHVAAQLFDINTNTSSRTDDHIRGYNLRGTMRAKLFGARVNPFLSTAYTKNDTLVTNDVSKRSPDRYQAHDYGTGVDFNIARRFHCAHDCADGIGVQYQQVQYQVGEGLVTTQRYVNVGATVWIIPNLSFGLRFAQYTVEAEQQPTAAGIAGGQTKAEIVTTGERSVIAGLRFVMQ